MDTTFPRRGRAVSLAGSRAEKRARAAQQARGAQTRIDEYEGWFNQPSRKNKYKIGLPVQSGPPRAEETAAQRAGWAQRQPYQGPRLIISGGQTGADEIALQCALRHHIPTSGFAPPGYLTSKGPNELLRTLYHLQEATTRVCSRKHIQTSSKSPYPARSILNVDLAGATVVFTATRSLGSLKTVEYARRGVWPPYRRVRARTSPASRPNTPHRPHLVLHLPDFERQAQEIRALREKEKEAERVERVEKGERQEREEKEKEKNEQDEEGGGRSYKLLTVVERAAASLLLFLERYRPTSLNIAGHRSAPATFPHYCTVVEEVLNLVFETYLRESQARGGKGREGREGGTGGKGGEGGEGEKGGKGGTGAGEPDSFERMLDRELSSDEETQ